MVSLIVVNVIRIVVRVVRRVDTKIQIVMDQPVVKIAHKVGTGFKQVPQVATLVMRERIRIKKVKMGVIIARPVNTTTKLYRRAVRAAPLVSIRT